MKDMHKFGRGEYENYYSTLPKADRDLIDLYFDRCLEGCSKNKATDMKRNLLKFRIATNKPFSDIDLKVVKHFVTLLKDSSYTDNTKNEILVHVLKFLKLVFKDWVERFESFESPLFKQIKEPKSKREITEKNVLSKDDIKKMLLAEHSTYWKAFLMCQYEGALRTLEVRTLTYEMLGNGDGDFYSFDLFATKNKKTKPIVFHEAKKWLDKLREEQINTGQEGKYIFHAKNNLNKPVDRGTISTWMRKLSKKALGYEVWSYLLRHSRATEYKKLIKNNVMSKDNALETMGHSEKMFDKIYSHVKKSEIRDMIKEQIYNYDDMPEEKKHELQKQIDDLTKKQEQTDEKWGKILDYHLKEVNKAYGLKVKNRTKEMLKNL